MSYHFLPVNSCCTDVVLNSHCGCSSTLPNTSCAKSLCGTNKTLSSTIVYNGPALTCTTAEPCDTLNVILQKIDEIICNLLNQINTLNIQVANITEQIININSQVININNTLDVCCNVTTTTTTTIAPYFKIILDDNAVGSLAGACALVFSVDLDIYVQNGIPVNGAFIYTDALQTIPFEGGEKYYKVQIIDLSFMAVQVSDTGEILSSLNC